MKVKWIGTFELVGQEKQTTKTLTLEGSGQEIDEIIRELVECLESKGKALIEETRKILER